MKSKLPSKPRVNPRVQIQVSDLARSLYMSNVTIQKRSSQVEEILYHFEKRDFDLSKRLFSDLLSSSLGNGEREYAFIAQFGALLFKSSPPKEVIAQLQKDAIAKFIYNENQCRKANRFITFDRSLPNLSDKTKKIVEKARWWLMSRLPPVSVVLPQIMCMSRPGPGATCDQVSPQRASSCWKYSEQRIGWYELGTDYHELLLASSAIHSKALLEWHDDCSPTVHSANKVTFVPKSVTSLRSIAIEPNGSMMVQLGIHEYLVKFLSKYGNSILSQERNQKLAREGSITGQLATIDLSNASDSISLALVYQMFPTDWFELLYRMRAPSGILPNGESIKYEKFASMGNGTTFAVETLLFLAICRAISSDRRVSVYGDDIIIPTSAAQILEEVLNELGFKFNNEKSFTSGPFRESCGCDWYNGNSVTPKYWRSGSDPLITEVYEFLNTCESVNPRINWSGVRSYLLNRISDSNYKLTFGPTYLPPDSCLHTSESYLRACVKRRWNCHTQTHSYRVIRFVSKHLQADEQKPYTALAMLRSGTRVLELPLRHSGSYRYVWTA